MPTPVYTWTVFLVDRRPGGAGIQDVTAYHQEDQSNLRGEARSKTEQKRLYLWIDDPAVSIACDDMMEVWAGWFDHAGNAWHPTKQPYGGYVLQHTGEQDGEIHIIDCLLTGFGWWASNTAILTWPTADPTAVQTGFPEDRTVNEWINTGYSYVPVGGTIPIAVPGLIAAHSGTVAADGIAPALAALPLPVGSLPGIPMIEAASVTGTFAFVYVADALNEIARAIHDAYNAIRPLIFWRAKVSGAELVPQFCMIDQNDTSGAVVLTVEASDTPATGHIVPRQPFKHLRDATHAAQGVIVKGIGGDPTLTGNPLVYHYEHITAHVNAYPNYHSTRGTWDLIKQERTIATVSEATTYAERIETQVWGPRGELSVVLERDDLADLGLTVDDIQEGLCLRYIDVVEGLDGVYPITKVAPFDVTGILVSFGFTPLDVGDLLVGGTAETPWVREGLSAAEYARRQVIGAPKFVPPTLTPSVTGQNDIKSRWKDVPGLWVIGQHAVNPVTGGTPDPAHIFGVTPVDQTTGDTLPANFWVSADGVPHGQDFHFGAVSAAGAVPGFLLVHAHTFIKVALLGTGTFELTRTTAGTTTSLQTFTNSGAYTVHTLTTPATFAPGDTVDGNVSSLTGTLYITVKEA